MLLVFSIHNTISNSGKSLGYLPFPPPPHTFYYCKSQQEHLALQRSLVIPNTHMHQVNVDLHSVFSSPLTTQPTKESGSSSHPTYGFFGSLEPLLRQAGPWDLPCRIFCLLICIFFQHPLSLILNSSCISLYSQQAEQGRAARELFNPFC